MAGALSIGSVLADRYRIDSVLGGGGYGVVFEAWDQDVGRRVALKIPRTSAGEADRELLERFRREAAAVARLQDPHTVTLFDYGEADGHLYMVCEFVAGTALGALLEERGKVSPDVTAKIALQVLSSLREAHGSGILHRDIKPDNIIIHEYMGDPYRAKLVDFGLAKETNRSENKLTQEGMVMGTAHYVSPEAYLLRPTGPTSDLYSLGMVMYEMLVGSPANDASTAIAVAQITANKEEYPIPEQIPEPLRSVVGRLIRKEPTERYQSASEAMSDLQDYVANSPNVDSSSPDFVPAPSVDRALGSQRQLNEEDFGASTEPALALDDDARRRPQGQKVSARSQLRGDAPDASKKTRPKRPRKAGGLLGFVAILLVVLGAVSVGIIWAFEIEMPWNKRPPVTAEQLSAKSFDVTSPDTSFFWVDWERGIVYANGPREIPPVGRCAMLLDSKSDPAPPNIYYPIQAVDSIPQVVEIEPVGREAVAEIAAQCDSARVAADAVHLSAEILASESKIADVKRREEMRSRRRAAARKQAEDATQKRGKVLKLLKDANTARRVIDVF